MTEKFEIVKAFLANHLQGVRSLSCYSDFPDAVGCDVNGTLDNPKTGQAIDDFLCDLQTRRIPVYIVSGRDRPGRGFRIVGLLENVPYDWFIEKGSPRPENPPGMNIDDDPKLRHSYSCKMGCTAVDPTGDEFIAFLDAWVTLSEEEKDQAIEPWLEFNREWAAGIAPSLPSEPPCPD